VLVAAAAAAAVSSADAGSAVASGADPAPSADAADESASLGDDGRAHGRGHGNCNVTLAIADGRRIVYAHVATRRWENPPSCSSDPCRTSTETAKVNITNAAATHAYV
jgi:hypothetical protein